MAAIKRKREGTERPTGVKKSRSVTKYAKERVYKKSMWLAKKAPVPTVFPTKLRYAERISVNPAASGVGAGYVYSANGLYDPNISGTGHQPRGFDQLMLLYDHYVVVGSKIDVTFTASTSAQSASTCLIGLRDSSSLSTDTYAYTESGYVTTGLINDKAGGDSSCRLTMATNPNKFLGRSKPLSDPDLKGSNSANPTEQAYYHLFVETIDGSADGATAFLYVILEYSVVFIEPKVPAES